MNKLTVGILNTGKRTYYIFKHFWFTKIQFSKHFTEIIRLNIVKVQLSISIKYSYSYRSYTVLVGEMGGAVF